MPFTANLTLNIPTPGDPAYTNAWGTTLNTDYTLLDTTTAGTLTLSVAGSSDVILTSSPGAVDQSRYTQYIFTGLLTGNITVLWPQSQGRALSVVNSTTGAFSLSLASDNGGGTPAGTTVVIPQGYSREVVTDGTNVRIRDTNYAAIVYTIDGGGFPITSGVKGDLVIPFPCTITGATLQSDQSGSVVVDIWKKTYATSSPPTVANTITAAALPTLSSAQSSQNTSLVGWTTAIAANDMLRFNLNSVSTITRLTITLAVLRG